MTGTGLPRKATGTLSVAGATAASIGTGADGSFSATLTIPGRARGSVAVVARVSGATASASFAVTPAAGPLRFGVATPGGARAGAGLDQVAQVAGEQPSVVLFYDDFTQDRPIADLDAIAARGATPLLTWEPWVAGAGADQARLRAGDDRRGRP